MLGKSNQTFGFAYQPEMVLGTKYFGWMRSVLIVLQHYHRMRITAISARSHKVGEKEKLSRLR